MNKAFAVGQKVKNRSGKSRTIIGIKGQKVSYKSGKILGVCTAESLKKWTYK